MFLVCSIDLALLVDTSGSMAIDPPYGKIENWWKVKNFMEMVVTQSYDDTWIAMITFDEKCVTFLCVHKYMYNRLMFVYFFWF